MTAERVAVVTGAASGIGRATALALAETGMNVLAVDLNKDGCHLLEASMPTVEAICGDLASEAVIAQVASRSEELGGCDVLVNNAAVMLGGDIVDLAVADWDRVFNVNVRAPFRLCQALLPSMLAKRSGVIVNVSSVMAGRAEPGSGAYSSSKAALLALSREIAVAYADRGVRCVAVCPGWVDTAMNRQVANPGQLAAQVRRQQPLGRMLSPEEVAGVIKFLTSSEASGLTGAAVAVDGGMGAYIAP